jgi:O-antigen ligase
MILLGSSMKRWLEAGLVGAVCVAVLGFGGTVPWIFAVTQVLVLGLVVCFLLTGEFSGARLDRFPLAIPLLLVAFVLLQICPLPIFLAPLFGRGRDAIAGTSHFTISMARYQTTSHLLLLITDLTAFFLTSALCQDRHAKKRLVFALLSLGAFEAGYGLIQYLTGWQQIFTYVKKYYLEEATGTYINRNHFAGFLEMIFPFTVALALRSATILFKNPSNGVRTLRRIAASTELMAVVQWLFLAVFLIAALVFSRSRMGIVSALVSLTAMLTLAGTASLRKRTITGIAALFLVGALGLVAWIGSEPVIGRFETLAEEYNLSRDNRIAIWRDTLGLIRQHPIMGTGLGSYSVVYPSVQTTFLNLLVEHAHCDYLEVTSELGLPAGILLFGSFFWVLARSVRQYREGEEHFDKTVSLGCIGSIAAILVHSLADFNLYIPANALVFTVILAMAWSTSHHRIAGVFDQAKDLEFLARNSMTSPKSRASRHYIEPIARRATRASEVRPRADILIAARRTDLRAV